MIAAAVIAALLGIVFLAGLYLLARADEDAGRIETPEDQAARERMFDRIETGWWRARGRELFGKQDPEK